MANFLQNVWKSFLEIFDPTVLSEQVAAWGAKLIGGILVFIVFYLLWLLLRMLSGMIFRRSRTDETTQSFIMTVVKYSVLILGVVNALSVMEIDTSSLLTSIGIVGITIGFAARDAFSNLIAGLLIYLDRPFVIGDLIEIGGNYGTVDRITLRSTRIITSDGKMLAVPNSEVVNTTVASYTNFAHLRLDIPVTVGVKEDLERVRSLLLDLVHDDPAFMDDPAPRVVTKSLNDYNVEMELQVWLENEREHVVKSSDLREAVFNTLTRAGVDMPYETLQLAPFRMEQ